MNQEDVGLFTYTGVLEVESSMAGFPKGDNKSVVHCAPLSRQFSGDKMHLW